MLKAGTITAKEVECKIATGQPMQIIDVREADEVEQGMIPGAVHIRLAELSDRLDEIRSDVDLVLVCRSGRRSRIACMLLEMMGRDNMLNMTDGMIGWKGQIIEPCPYQ